MIDLSRENPQIRGLLKELFPRVRTEDISSLVEVAEIEQDEQKTIPFDLRYLRIVKEEVDFFYNVEKRRKWSKSRVRRRAHEVAAYLEGQLIESNGLSQNGKVISTGKVIDEVLWYLRYKR